MNIRPSNYRRWLRHRIHDTSERIGTSFDPAVVELYHALFKNETIYTYTSVLQLYPHISRTDVLFSDPKFQSGS